MPEKINDEKKEIQPAAESSILIEKAIQAAERIEAANKRQEELLKRQEELIAKNILGGRSEAGITPQQINPETEKKERLKNYWKGSAIEQAFK